MLRTRSPALRPPVVHGSNDCAKPLEATAEIIPNLRLDPPLDRGQGERMNLETIRKRLRDGFRPFVIRTADGHEYPVPHPEFILITSRVVAVADDDGDVISLDPLHIVGVKDFRQKKKSDDNHDASKK